MGTLLLNTLIRVELYLNLKLGFSINYIKFDLIIEVLNIAE